MDGLKVDFLEQTLRMRISSDTSIPEDKFPEVRKFARQEIDQIYGRDGNLWEFSEMRRISSTIVDVVFYYME